jgi:hypothetical protein
VTHWTRDQTTRTLLIVIALRTEPAFKAVALRTLKIQNFHGRTVFTAKSAKSKASRP